MICLVVEWNIVICYGVWVKHFEVLETPRTESFILDLLSMMCHCAKCYEWNIVICWVLWKQISKGNPSKKNKIKSVKILDWLLKNWENFVSVKEVVSVSGAAACFTIHSVFTDLITPHLLLLYISHSPREETLKLLQRKHGWVVCIL